MPCEMRSMHHPQLGQHCPPDPVLDWTLSGCCFTEWNQKEPDRYIWNPQCLWLCNKSYAPEACTSVDAIWLLFDSYSKINTLSWKQQNRKKKKEKERKMTRGMRSIYHPQLRQHCPLDPVLDWTLSGPCFTSEIKKSTIDIWNPWCLWLCNRCMPLEPVLSNFGRHSTVNLIIFF